MRGRRSGKDENSGKRPVRKIGSLIGQLMARRGYAQGFANDELQRMVEAAAGPAMAGSIRVGNLRSGVLQIYALDSVTLQELNFSKRQILRRIQAELPAGKVTDLRFRILAG